MDAVRKNRYVILPKDFEKGYKTNVKKPHTDFEFYKWWEMEARSKAVFFFENVTSQRNSDYHIMCASTSYMFSYDLSWTIRAMYCKNICTWRADYDEDLVRRISQKFTFGFEGIMGVEGLQFRTLLIQNELQYILCRDLWQQRKVALLAS
jgi:hypothetical protein